MIDIFKANTDRVTCLQVFTGNSDSDSLVTNYLDANVYNVRYARIYPQAWTNGVSCRLEILGCSSRQPHSIPSLDELDDTA